MLLYNFNVQYFTFDTSEWKVVGIDENGYGPLLGPLVVTGVLLTLYGADPTSASEIQTFSFPIPIRDSKELFRRSLSSYRLGESVVITILEVIGKRVPTLSALIRELSIKPLDLEDYGIQDVALPAFGGIVNKDLIDYFEKAGIHIDEIVVNVIMPDIFNKIVEDLGNKALIDFKAFMEVKEKLSASCYLMGKVGGTSHYGRFFEIFNIKYEILKDSFSKSSYKLENGEYVHFILHADREYLPVTFAGIVGKYVRELIMLSLSRSLGFNADIPYASGYYHDSKTFEIERMLKNNMKIKWVRSR